MFDRYEPIRRCDGLGLCDEAVQRVADGKVEGQGKKRFIVDFAQGDLDFYLADPGRVEIVASTTAGTIASTIIQPNHDVKGFRVIVDASLPDGESAELRMFLKARGRTLTETWTSTWSVAAAAGDGKAVRN